MNGPSYSEDGLNCFGNDHDEEEWIKLVFQYMLLEVLDMPYENEAQQDIDVMCGLLLYMV